MSPLPDEDRTRLLHIRDAVEEALSYAEGRSRSDLDSDGQLVRALERLVEIIGEAASKISDETTKRTPEIPWREIRGMRTWLAHAYFRVNLDYVWETVEDELPKLRDMVRRVIDGAEADDAR